MEEGLLQDLQKKTVACGIFITQKHNFILNYCISLSTLIFYPYICTTEEAETLIYSEYV